MSEQEKLISSNKNDLIASASRSVAGAVPFVGQLLTELVDKTIPNQRFERLTKYVIKLETRLSQIEEEELKELWQEDENIALMESGYIHASLALSDERRAYIASIVANGLSDDAAQQESSKYLLGLLSELNDTEIIWLRFYLNLDTEFRQRHANVLEPAQPYAEGTFSKKECHKAALQDSYVEHLERLGLIGGDILKDRKTKMPLFDEITGKPRVNLLRVTDLGRMLLREMDLLDERN